MPATDPSVADPFDLARFVSAQSEGVHERALAELVAGRKTTHWMWFVLPQLAGLGSSPMAERYGIRSLAEARAYLAHPVLGPRYAECAGVLADSPAGSAREVLGGVDAVKARSSTTLFRAAAAALGTDAERAAVDAGRLASDLGRVLARWFDGEDPVTLRMLAEESSAPHAS